MQNTPPTPPKICNTMTKKLNYLWIVMYNPDFFFVVGFKMSSWILLVFFWGGVLIFPNHSKNLLPTPVNYIQWNVQFNNPVQPHHINMAMLFWYLAKSDLSSVPYCTSVHWISHFLLGTRNSRQCITVTVLWYTVYSFDRVIKV